MRNSMNLAFFLKLAKYLGKIKFFRSGILVKQAQIFWFCNENGLTLVLEMFVPCFWVKTLSGIINGLFHHPKILKDSANEFVTLCHSFPSVIDIQMSITRVWTHKHKENKKYPLLYFVPCWQQHCFKLKNHFKIPNNFLWIL